MTVEEIEEFEELTFADMQLDDETIPVEMDFNIKGQVKHLKLEIKKSISPHLIDAANAKMVNLRTGEVKQTQVVLELWDKIVITQPDWLKRLVRQYKSKPEKVKVKGQFFIEILNAVTQAFGDLNQTEADLEYLRKNSD